MSFSFFIKKPCLFLCLPDIEMRIVSIGIWVLHLGCNRQPIGLIHIGSKISQCQLKVNMKLMSICAYNILYVGII